MRFLVNFCIAAALLVGALAAPKNNFSFSALNSAEDYFKIAQAELLVKVQLAEKENDAIDARFLDRLAVIELQRQQVLNETRQVNQTIIPLQALNVVRKYCIQTYDSQFITYSQAKKELKACEDKALNLASSLTTKSKEYTQSAKKYATETLPRNLKTYCQLASYKSNQTKLEGCYIDYVEKALEFVQGNLDNAKHYRELSIFDINDISLSAVQCSFKVEKAVLESITVTSKKINDCVSDNKNALNGNF